MKVNQQLLRGLQELWKQKYIQKLAADDRKSYLSYSNKLVDESVLLVKSLIHADYFALTGEIETNPKVPKFEVGDRVKITKYKNISSKGYINKWSKEMFLINSVLKTNPKTCKIKDLNGKE